MCASTATNQFWVSPTGNDDNPGTKEAPFQTILRAQSAVRDILRNRQQTSDITVWIEEGIYRLLSPLFFGSGDSGQFGYLVRFQATPGASPKIYGSKPVGGWVLHDAEKQIYRASVGAVRSRQLYVNGVRANRASTTNYPDGFMPRYDKGGIQYMPATSNSAAWRDPGKWTRFDRIEAVLYCQWKMISVPLDELALPATSLEPGLITVQQPGWENSNLFVNTVIGITATEGLWRITKFENAYEFLTDPGEWYLDETAGELYYIPRPGEHLLSGDVEVELPVLETLIDARGSVEAPVQYIEFNGLTFAHATWLSPSSGTGYVSDQSGFHVTGTGHRKTTIGHVQHVTRTPGNLHFDYARYITIHQCTFQHLGAIAIDFYRGSKYNTITENYFNDISSSAFQLGEVATSSSPLAVARFTTHNTFSHNTIQQVGREFVDAAGIFVGFSEYTTISYNTITDVPWSGIAMGWGWGLLDPEGFAGLPGAHPFEWGGNHHHTVNQYNRILYNSISRFMQVSWDAGAIYTTGYQGTSDENALLIEGNIARDKNPALGGNVFYTDGGSRYVKVVRNHSINNPIGYMDFGPPPKDDDPVWDWDELGELAREYFMTKFDKLKYGHDIGGCRTYGDITYIENTGISTDYFIVAPCIYFHDGRFYPVNMQYEGNTSVPEPSIE